MRNNLKKIAKKKKGWSLYKLAQMTGIQAHRIYEWNSGSKGLGLKNALMLSDVLECSVNELMEKQKWQ